MLDFISLFDTRTTVLLVSLAFFIQANAIGAQAFLIREYKGVRTALLGNLCIALGFFLNLFQGTLPNWVSIALSNFLLLQGPNLFQIAFSRFLEVPYSKRAIVGLTIIQLSVSIYFTFISFNLVARIVGVSLCIGTSVLIASSKLWKARKRPYKFSVWLTMVPLTIYGLFLFVRIIPTIISPPESSFSNTPFQTLTFLLLFVISFLWTIGFILMVSQRLQVDLTELANVDSLTRIPNRHATQIFFERELSRKVRYGSEFSILLIDLDNFKQIIDTYGHAAGDLALVNAAKIFHSSIRKQDIAGRWGGEEFLLILPQTPLDDAKLLAERLRVKAMEPNNEKQQSAYITISVGVASSNECSSIDQILKKADDALYVAKATKNAIVAAN